MPWVVSRYEPPTRIEFTCFVAGSHVKRLKIALTAAGDGTRLDWTNCWMAIGPRGDAWISACSADEDAKKLDNLRLMLTHYLATGKMLRP